MSKCSLEWCTRAAVVRWTPPNSWAHADPCVLCHEHSLGIRRLSIGRFDPAWPSNVIDTMRAEIGGEG